MNLSAAHRPIFIDVISFTSVTAAEMVPRKRAMGKERACAERSTKQGEGKARNGMERKVGKGRHFAVAKL